MTLNTNQIQLKAFELELHGFTTIEISMALTKEIKIPRLTAKNIKHLIDAETILYGLASMVSDKTMSNELSFRAEPQDIVVWPDYTWCYVDELAEFDYKSDDHVTGTVTFDSEPTQEQLEELIGGYLLP